MEKETVNNAKNNENVFVMVHKKKCDIIDAVDYRVYVAAVDGIIFTRKKTYELFGYDWREGDGDGDGTYILTSYDGKKRIEIKKSQMVKNKLKNVVFGGRFEL